MYGLTRTTVPLFSVTYTSRLLARRLLPHYRWSSKGVIMLRKVSLMVSLAVGSFIFVGTASADQIVVANTGETAPGGPALAVGILDPNYSLISAPPTVPLTAITTFPNPAWTANTPTADWISPGASGGTSWPVGTYDYQTTFSLAGLDPSTAQLSGEWTSDNNGCLFLNGANTNSCTSFANFGSFIPFSITSGFNAGANTLDFVIYNGGGPTGVIAEVSGSASPISSVVPEPSSLMLMGSGLLGLGGLLRRKLLGR